MREIMYADQGTIEDIKTLLETEGGCSVIGMPEEQYFAFPAFGSSQVMEMMVCPRYFWHGTHWCPEHLRRDKVKSEALEFGSQMHKYLLEPEDFYNEYRVRPSTEGTLATIADLIDFGQTQGVELPKAKKDELEEIVLQRWPHAHVWSKIKREYEEGIENGSVKPITHEKMELVKNMAETLKAEEIYLGDELVPLGRIFERGEAEKTFIWRHEKTGLDIMCRVDWLLANIIFEYRTAMNASKRGFESASVKRKYQNRAGFYWNIIRKVTGQDPSYYYIAQEKEKPYLAALYEQTQDDLASGWAVAEECLEKIAECVAKGDPRDKRNWPGLNDNRVIALDLPDYAFKPLEGGE